MKKINKLKRKFLSYNLFSKIIAIITGFSVGFAIANCIGALIGATTGYLLASQIHLIKKLYQS